MRQWPWVSAVTHNQLKGTTHADRRALERPGRRGEAYVSGADPKHYQPANITFDLLPALDEETRARFRHDKRARHTEVCRRALEKLDEYRAVYA